AVNTKDLKKISGPEKVKASPKRVQFKSSFGYGHLQKNYKLSFASLSGGTKTGDTPEGMMVIPESVAMYCELDYESAVEKGKLDECLRKLNTISTSMVTEERAKKEIDDATKDVNNGYVEYLTATYFEALETYNDSLTFKGNELDPVMTTKTSDIDASWRIAKEMHLVLGERVNKLRKLWARVLGMKMYSKYASEKFVSKE
ncbi:MAG: hypothetical protein IKA30_02470, partial [Alphaproteobacteria bacterium]|nr:hypothetical protein [Alphaproteobacteria bacterium]